MRPEKSEETQSKIENFADHAKEFLNTKYELYKLQLVDKTSSVLASAVIWFIVAMFFVLIIVLVSIGFALYLNKVFNHPFSGFFAVAGIYLIIGFILYAFKNSLLKKPFANLFINEILND